MRTGIHIDPAKLAEGLGNEPFAVTHCALGGASRTAAALARACRAIEG